ncbi:unnamed protein product [Dibothriocephalus latus]|uniref:C-type lectin domain-containing protein n=1 Tax=Dibothriocephalus latus TaxID=60516 RepID=A0A3P6TSL4_DIBLA|nr:unnamed protein product [Dibothriocephalus latus]
MVWVHILLLTVVYYPPSAYTAVRYYKASNYFVSNAGDPKTNFSTIQKMTTGGFSYSMLPQKKLSFQQAEQFCLQDSSNPMHISSVLNEQEWLLICKMFGNEQPLQIWLGGEVKRSPTKPTFNLYWIDRNPFSYHRFSKEEQNAWLDNRKPLDTGCLAAELTKDGSGNWTVVHAPCTEARAFICKGVHKNEQPDHFIERPFLNALSQWPLDLLIKRLTSWRLLDPWLLNEFQREATAEDSKPFRDTTVVPIYQSDGDDGLDNQREPVILSPVTPRPLPAERNEVVDKNSTRIEEPAHEPTTTGEESMFAADAPSIIDTKPKSTGLQLDDDHELALINELLDPKVNPFNIGNEAIF